ncbi:MAG: ABC transporter substrate-binding protein [Thermoprotei archaeon]|nr:ABC transporter substrate-binding protein [Thermoprotei archaeon]
MKYIKNPNPMKVETWYDWWFNLVIYEFPFRTDPNLEPKPWLCTSYEVSSDGLVWTFSVVKNATWHDGIPFTARDIAFTINFLKKYRPPDWYPNIMYINKVDVVDDYTIRVYLNKTFVWMIRRFGDTIILPEHIWEYVAKAYDDPTQFNPLDENDVAKVLEVMKKEAPSEVYNKVNSFVEKYKHLRIGLGPFILANWKEGEFLEMVKNPDYFKKGYPNVGKLVYKVYKDPQAQYLAVKKGEAHIMVWTLPYAVIEKAEKDPNIIVPKTPDVFFGYIGLNTKDPILSNRLVRKAIAYAINKTEIVETLMLGYAMPAYTYVHPGYKAWVAEDVPRYEFNLTKAAELLDQAGLRDVDSDGIRETPEGQDAI